MPLQLQYIASYPPEKLLLFLVVTAAVIHIIVVVVCSCSSCCFCKCCRYTDCALPAECPQVPAGLPGKVGTSAQVLVEGATIPSLGVQCHNPSPHHRPSLGGVCHYPSPHYFDHRMDIMVRYAQRYWHHLPSQLGLKSSAQVLVEQD